MLHFLEFAAEANGNAWLVAAAYRLRAFVLGNLVIGTNEHVVRFALACAQLRENNADTPAAMPATGSVEANRKAIGNNKFGIGIAAPVATVGTIRQRFEFANVHSMPP